MPEPKDWIYGSRGPNPPPQPTRKCEACGRERNALSTYRMDNGQRWCFDCARREAPIAD